VSPQVVRLLYRLFGRSTPPARTPGAHCQCGAWRPVVVEGAATDRKVFALVTLGFLSTYPPTLCGLASFTASLRGALPAEAAGGVVRVVDSADEPRPAGVVGELVAGSARSCRDAAAMLDRHDVAVVQHDGGADAADVLRVLTALSVPAVVVLHGVPATPTAPERAALNRITAAAAAVVTMSEVARARLLALYDAPADRVHVIPHGSHDRGNVAAATPHRNQRRQILTWGLLGPGKGIEWGIEAMALLGDLRPAPRYVVAGHTHPKVLAREGERYRNHLVSLAESLGIGDRVRFDPRYLDPLSLSHLVARAQVILLPYDSRDQTTSAVLAEAVRSRTPVVATRFPHAVELLSGGAGVLVDHQNPASIADAVRTVLADRALAARMGAAAGVTAGTAEWTSVARQFCRLATGLVRTPAHVTA
jgi:glycosyltransferase involved in cell wall biosynthesis